MRKTILWLIVVLVMGVIFLLSNEPATASREGSIAITSKVLELLRDIFPNLSIDGDSLHHTIRKFAHFFIYLGLGSFTFAACLLNRKTVSYNVVLTMVICVLFAISDEVHQLFVPGRSGEVGDVFIDGFGALLGILLVLAIKWVVNRTRKLDQN